MTISMYDAAVPVFRRYLGQLSAMLDLAEARPDAPALLEARLAHDMYPFVTQVEIAANFAVRACAPLSRSSQRGSGVFPASYEGLRARIAFVLRFLESLEPAQFADAAGRIITEQAGKAEVSLPGLAFLLEYALPNFLFHLTTAYAILRQQGVAVGKADFDGFHLYPGRA